MSFAAKYVLYYPIQWFRQEPIRKCMQELHDTQFLSPKRLAEWQLPLVKQVIDHAAGKIPYYQEKFRAAGFTAASLTSFADYAKVPCLTKTDLRNYSKEFIDPTYRGPLSSKTTGGSTGQAVTVVKDRVASAYSRGVMWRNYGWWGIDIGDRQGRLWGIPLLSRQRYKYKLIDLLSNRIRLSSFEFSDDDLREYYRRLSRFRPRYLYGYASMIYEFAAFLDREKLQFSVPVVVPTSEVLYRNQRDLIQKVFNCQIANEYGCGEVGPIAFECPSGGTHLMADNLYIEVLREDGSPAQPGETGQVVVTELHSKAMPLIRYQIMDSVVLGESECACGRGLPLIREIIGRSYDYLVSREGKRFHGEKVMYLLEHLQDIRMGIRNLQVIQNSYTDLTVHILRDSDFNERAIAAMRKYFMDALGADLTIEFKFVDAIPRAPSGKFRVVVRNF